MGDIAQSTGITRGALGWTIERTFYHASQESRWLSSAALTT
ncbi:hypothetical protein [Streptomyces noursei]|nr:hypothetical protein [Streptomyces noursei]